MSESSQTQLRNEIKKIVDNKWNRDKSPVLLSHLGGDLLDKSVNYKDLTHGVSLSAFIKLQDDLFTLIRHPTQKLKVGVFPVGETYEFEPEVVTETNMAGDTQIKSEGFVVPIELRKSRRVLYSFINELSKLSVPEREGINIPVNVLIRMMEGK